MSRLRSTMFAFLAFAFLMLFVPTTHAQTRWLIGGSGAAEFDNYDAGITAGVEFPFLKHYELDLKDTFSPIASHTALGHGRANITSASGIVWFSQNWGLTGGAEDSMYDVTKVTKDSDFAFGGFVYRAVLGGMPTRIFFRYLKQFNNGVTPSGLESSHLQGGSVGFTTRFGCLGAMCVRTSEELSFGHVLEQGNQACDGSLPIVKPNVYCGPRTGALGGGVSGSIVLEFPRRKNHEYDRF